MNDLEGMGEKRRLEAAWQTYLAILPHDAPPVQIRETRNAFYGGARALVSILVREADDGPEPTENDLALMTGLSRELDEFVDELRLRNTKARRARGMASD